MQWLRKRFNNCFLRKEDEMTNCKITNLWQGNRANHLFVIADSERFGKNEIMYEGTLAGCVAYLHRYGIKSYKACY